MECFLGCFAGLRERVPREGQPREADPFAEEESLAFAEEARLAAEKRTLTDAHKQADEAPLEEMRQALLSAQDDLKGKVDEAAALKAKVSRLEHALQELM